MNSIHVRRWPLCLEIICLIALVIAWAEAKDQYRGDEFFQFRTRPDILAPRWTVTRHGGANAVHTDTSGYWFVAPYKDVGGTDRGEPWVGPYIYDQYGELVWSGAPLLEHFGSFDFRVSEVDGEDMLTVIYPHDNAALVLDSTYALVHRVIHSDSEENSNMHEFNVLENGTRALVLTKNETPLSREQLEPIGFVENCTARGDGLKYLDISGGSVKELFVWKGIEHIGIEDSNHRDSKLAELCKEHQGWDVFHFNSADLFPDGDILLSASHTNTVYKISSKDGSIKWRLGGPKSDFSVGPRAKFSFQHHARVQSQNSSHTVISLFDNAKGGPEQDRPTTRGHSAGLMILLDTMDMKAQLLAEFPRPRGHFAYTWKRGSTQMLPNGHAFIGWADSNLVSEHAPDGELLLEAEMIPNLGTYRSYKFPWVGRPANQPAVYSAAFIAGSAISTTVYVSWNGATEVVRWRLCEADVLSKCKRILLTSRKRGFETEMMVNEYVELVVVQAMDINEQVLRTSRLARTIPPLEGEQLPDDDGRNAHLINSATNQSYTTSYTHPMASATNESWMSYFHPFASATQRPYQLAPSRVPLRLMVLVAFVSGLTCGYALRYWRRILTLVSRGNVPRRMEYVAPSEQNSHLEGMRVSAELKR